MASTSQRRVFSGLATAKTAMTGSAIKVFSTDYAHQDGDVGAVNFREIKASQANTGNCYIGPSTVTAGNGLELAPGESYVVSGPAGAGFLGDLYAIGTGPDSVSTIQY